MAAAGGIVQLHKINMDIPVGTIVSETGTLPAHGHRKDLDRMYLRCIGLIVIAYVQTEI